jgi:hypothetical protein
MYSITHKGLHALIVCITLLTSAKAAQKTFSGTGSWSNTARWSGGSLPLSTDDVIMAYDANCTFDVASATCASLDIAVFLVLSGTLNLGSNTLTVTGDVTGSAGLGSLTLGSGTLNIGGNLAYSGTLTAGTGSTVNYNGTAQSIRAITYYNLTLSNSDTKTAAGAIPIINNFTINSGVTYNAANNQLTRSGSGTATITINGTYSTTDADGFSGSSTTSIHSTGTSIVLGSTSVIQYATSGTQAISARTDYTRIIVSGSGTKTPAGTTTLSGDLDVSAGTFAVAGNTVTITGNLTGSGAVSLTTGTLNLEGNYSNSGALSPGTTSTIHYTGTLSQSVKATTYTNLSFSNTGVKTFAGAIVITAGRTLLVNASATVNAGNNQVTATGATVIITINGTYMTADADGFSGSTATAISNANTTISALTTTSTIQYNAASGNQSVTAELSPYGNIILSGSGSAKTIAANFTMLPGTVFTLDQGVLFDMGTRNVQNSAGTGTVTFTINGIFYTRLQAGFSGGSTAIQSTGTTINLGSSSVIYYGRTSAQTISARTDYAVMRIDGSSTKTMDGAVTVNDSLDIINGEVVIGTNTLTLNGKLGGSGRITGSSSSSLTVEGSGGNTDIALSQTSKDTRTLNTFIYNRTSQSISLTDSLEITGAIIPTAGTLVTNGKLRLVSNASGTARIAAGTGSYISGNVIAERYIPAVARRFRFLTSTVTNATLLDWQNETFITGAGTGNTPGTLNSNGFDATLSNQSGIYAYDETLSGSSSIGWLAVTNNTSSLSNMPLTPGTGFRLFIRGDRSSLDRLTGVDTTQNEVTLNLNGPVNTGDISLPVTYTNSGSPANDGWNLAGNAYPCQYDWNAYYDAAANYTNIAPTVYIYDPANNNYKSYNATSNTGTLTDGIIPAGAGIYIQATGTPSMTLVEAYKTSAAQASVFKTAIPDFAITLKQSDDNYDKVILKYMEGTSEGFDANDIRKMDGPDLNLSIVAGADFLTASCKPFNGLSDIIPMKVDVHRSGEYTFEFDDPAVLLPSTHVALLDKYLNKTIDLREIHSYTFTVDEEQPHTYGSSRFAIVVGEQTFTSVEEEERQPVKDKISISPQPAQDLVTITGSYTDEVNISVFDMAGRMVEGSKQTGNSGKVVLNLSGYRPGVYVISLENKGKLQTIRCVKQ